MDNFEKNAGILRLKTINNMPDNDRYMELKEWVNDHSRKYFDFVPGKHPERDIVRLCEELSVHLSAFPNSDLPLDRQIDMIDELVGYIDEAAAPLINKHLTLSKTTKYEYMTDIPENKRFILLERCRHDMLKEITNLKDVVLSGDEEKIYQAHADLLALDTNLLKF